MNRISKIGLGMAGVLALVLTQAAPAHADGEARSTDVVGIGSDTLQYAMDFAAEGDYNGTPGYNATRTTHRIVNFDASGDANGRTTTVATSPAPTSVLRGGTFPVVRLNGSGAGIGFILNTDTTTPFAANYVRSSRMPKPAEQTQASSPPLNYGGLHCYQIGIDGLAIAVSNLQPTDAGTGGLTIDNLVQIYSQTGNIRKWGDIPTYNGPTPNNAIAPIIPQTGSGTRDFFITQLTNAAGGSFTLRTDTGLKVGEEHDPSLVQSNPDAISPFSTARLQMINKGYFNGGVALSPQPVVLLPSPASFSTTRPILIIVRQNSVTNPSYDGLPAVWNNGKSWADALFTPGGFMSTNAAKPLVQAAGFTYQYADLGLCQA